MLLSFYSYAYLKAQTVKHRTKYGKLNMTFHCFVHNQEVNEVYKNLHPRAENLAPLLEKKTVLLIIAGFFPYQICRDVCEREISISRDYVAIGKSTQLNTQK